MSPSIDSEFSQPRRRANLSIDQLADHLGYSARTVYRWERGEIVPRTVALRYLRSFVDRTRSTKSEHPTFRFVDLFAGIGGLRRGFEPLGGTCVYTSEWNRFAKITYLANYDCEHAIAGDITKVDVDEIPEHDVLLAGFPCQPFSIAGVSKKNALNKPHGFRCPADWLPPALLPRRPGRVPAGLPAVRLRRPVLASPGPLDRLARPAPPAAGAAGAASSLPTASLGAREMPGVEGPGAEPAPAGRGMAAGPRNSARAGGDLCQRRAQVHLLPGLELALPGTDLGARSVGPGACQDAQGSLRVSAEARLASGPARTPTPCALALNAGLPSLASADPLRPGTRMLTARLHS